MKKSLYLIITTLILQGCFPTKDDVGPIVEPPEMVLLKKDSLTTGSYMGLTIGNSANSVYATLQRLQDSVGLKYVNMTYNFVSNLEELKTRLPLYSYILFDQESGTSQGVQISLEGRKVKSIYLNSGKQLTQWPEDESSAIAVRQGDNSETTATKLIQFSKDRKYAPQFQRTSLAIKTVSENFDPLMAESPQWFFGYSPSENHSNYVYLYFIGGTLEYIIVEYKRVA